MATCGSNENNLAYSRGKRGVDIEHGKKYGVAENLGIDLEQRRLRLV